MRRIRASERNFLRNLYNQCKMRHARDRHVGEIVTWEVFTKSYSEQAGMCAVSGLRFDISDSSRSPSPDRIDNNVGYVPGNVQFVTWQVNNMRGSMSLHEFRDMCRVVVTWNGR